MREHFPQKKTGDTLSAEFINRLAEAVRQYAAGPRPDGSEGFHNNIGSVIVPPPLSMPTPVQVTGEEADGLYPVRPLYFDQGTSAKGWLPDDGAGPWDLDATATGLQLSEGDITHAYWHNQRGAYVPVTASGTVAIVAIYHDDANEDDVVTENSDGLHPGKIVLHDPVGFEYGDDCWIKLAGADAQQTTTNRKQFLAQLNGTAETVNETKLPFYVGVQEPADFKPLVAFTLDEALALTDDAKAATITAQYGNGINNNTAITVHNQRTSAGASNYIFEGDAGDYGLAQHDSGTDYRIIQMECPA